MIGQQTVSTAMAFGVVGELFLDGPHRAQPIIIDSDGVTNPNRVGRVFTFVAGADGHAVVGGVGALAGILANPKVYALFGNTTDGAIGPSLDLPRYSAAEAVYDTTGIIVALPAAANVGDLVDYNTTTGVIVTRAGNVVPSAGTVAVASNVATVAALATTGTAGTPKIGIGSKIKTGATELTVQQVLTGTGGNGTYAVASPDFTAAAITSFSAALATGTKNLPGFEVVRYNIPAAGLGVVGNLN